jgi:hypothetical protein
LISRELHFANSKRSIDQIRDQFTFLCSSYTSIMPQPGDEEEAVIVNTYNPLGLPFHPAPIDVTA